MTDDTVSERKSQSESRPLSGRVAVVTGASGGLGRAIVAELRQSGADVFGVDVAGDCEFKADLSTASGNREMISHFVKQAGRLDILVLNAGCQFVAPLDEFPDAEWERLRSVMLDGPFYALKAAWPALTKNSGGRVVVTASSSSFRGARRKAAYVASKHGVLGLVRVAALEGAPFGLTVNAVAPGWVDTGMMRGQLKAQSDRLGIEEDEVIARFRADQPGDRFVESREIAAAVGFLVSPRASAVNGVCLPVDIGATV